LLPFFYFDSLLRHAEPVDVHFEQVVDADAVDPIGRGRQRALAIERTVVPLTT
jgi:hypothetical protein